MLLQNKVWLKLEFKDSVSCILVCSPIFSYDETGHILSTNGSWLLKSKLKLGKHVLASLGINRGVLGRWGGNAVGDWEWKSGASTLSEAISLDEPHWNIAFFVIGVGITVSFVHNRGGVGLGASELSKCLFPCALNGSINSLSNLPLVSLLDSLDLLHVVSNLLSIWCQLSCHGSISLL